MDAFSTMEQLVSKSSPYFYPLSVGFTALVLILSVIFTYKRFLQNNQRPQSVNEKKMDEKATHSQQKTHTDQSQVAEDDVAPGEVGDGDAPLISSNLQPEMDPLTYCEHIQSEVKKAKQRVTAKKFNKDLTEEQIEEEREVQRRQLQSIFELMQTESDRFGISSLEDVQSQMKLYA
ncbi:matrix-remodeling-associated protein 7-like [Saccostrea echinata]|uniref:matrix-remodeling-associated protein 7-like n=1 Tax=Saccostrea echinata TaxID=191078 RepID=UPI002A82E700|nr:matrix-remodeling-associated protein 7-like [Saccostrea echinata]